MIRFPSQSLLLVLASGLFSPLAAAQGVGEFEPIHFGDAPEYRHEQPFFPGATYDPQVASPDSALGQPLGSRLARHHEIVEVFRGWAESSGRLDLATYGETYEGRPLLRAVISSAANIERLDEIRDGLRRLADPRGLSAAQAEELIASLPAVAWIGHSVHGDELSGADASMAIGYHLLAGTNPEVTALLDEVLVVIDPAMNPDGRERIVSQIEQSFGYVQNLDYASMHRGRWPGGRGNHYLFDMNRDWMTGICPETRGRWQAVREFPPQLFIDAHEMSGLDTFLFYPQSDPHNSEMSAHITSWQSRFADDHAEAFDRYGWGYYTREWADAWYPAYSDAWGTLNSAIGMLYEQGSTDGQALRRASGEVVSYRESVHGQATAAMANLGTLAANRAEILTGYLAERRRNVSAEQLDAERMFVARPSGNRSRLADLAERLVAQGIEVELTSEVFTATGVVDALLAEHDQLEAPAGSLIVRVRQPQAPLVRAFLGFDPRMSQAALERERHDLESGEGSHMYDITAWDLGRAFDLDCFWADAVEVEARAFARAERPARAIDAGPFVAWAVDASDDTAIVFAAAALGADLVLHVAGESFRAAGHDFPAGSLILRRHENEAPESSHRPIEERIASAAAASGADVVPLTTLRSPDSGPDLGGQTFTLLARPKLAIVTGEGVSREGFGHLWRFIDEELRLSASLIEASSLGAYDLRRFNVLLLPPGAGRAARRHADSLATWVEGGGTLVAVGSAAASLAGSELSSVVRRRDALEELDEYAWVVARERAARDASVDVEALYASPSAVGAATEQAEADADEAGPSASADAGTAYIEGAPDAATADAWRRRFAPSGVLLRAEVDTEHWLNSGWRAAEQPVFYSGSSVLLTPSGVSAPLRLAPLEQLRLGGLLWPEAAERIADSAWATVEGRGAGQVILFADSPVFRGFFKGTSRAFANALILGPGAGASQPIEL